VEAEPLRIAAVVGDPLMAVVDAVATGFVDGFGLRYGSFLSGYGPTAGTGFCDPL
jgi:hypothetical protein